MTVLHKADAARRQTIFEPTNFNSSSPKTNIYNKEKLNKSLKNKYTELQNTSTSNFKQPQIQYVQAGPAKCVWSIWSIPHSKNIGCGIPQSDPMRFGKRKL